MVSSQYVPSRQSNAPQMLAGSGHHPVYPPNRGPQNKAPGCALDGNDRQSIGSRVLFHIAHALRTSSGHISSQILPPGNEAFSSDPCLWGPHLPAVSLLLKHTRYRPAPRPSHNVPRVATSDTRRFSGRPVFLAHPVQSDTRSHCDTIACGRDIHILARAHLRRTLFQVLRLSVHCRVSSL